MRDKLKDIKERFQEATLIGALHQDFREDMMWLITQVEMAEQYVNNHHAIDHVINEKNRRIKELYEENQRLNKSLEDLYK